MAWMKTATLAPTSPAKTRTATTTARRRRTPRTPVAGLCLTCVHVARCTFPRTAGQVVRHCDEFSGGAAALPLPAAQKPAPKARTRVAGLCSNCAHAKACRFPKHEGGVWNCEEYA